MDNWDKFASVHQNETICDNNMYTTLGLYPHAPLQGKETVGQIKWNTT